MRHSTDHILTTHVGSLPRPHDLLDILKQRLDGKAVDDKAIADKLRQSVEEMVHKQVDAGIDIVADGEMSMSSPLVLQPGGSISADAGWALTKASPAIAAKLSPTKLLQKPVF